MGLMGRKIYISSWLQTRIANRLALLSKYNFVYWMAMSKYEDQLPKASRKDF